RGEGGVRGAVVHEDQLEGARPRLEDGNRPPIELVHRAGLVVERDDDGDVGRRKIGVDRSPALERLRACHAGRIVARSLHRGTRAPLHETNVTLVPAATLHRRLLFATAITLYAIVFVAF